MMNDLSKWKKEKKEDSIEWANFSNSISNSEYACMHWQFAQRIENLTYQSS